MNKILILHSSASGNTAQIASLVAEDTRSIANTECLSWLKALTPNGGKAKADEAPVNEKGNKQ